MSDSKEALDVEKSSMEIVKKFYRESLGDIDLTMMIRDLCARIEADAVRRERERAKPLVELCGIILNVFRSPIASKAGTDDLEYRLEKELAAYTAPNNDEHA